LIDRLLDLDEQAPQITVHIPREILVYVQEGRNPEIYTREFLELVMRQNQKLKGKADAFAQFRDILARELSSAMPDMKPQVREVVLNTGGSLEI
jgi:mediator of RNA polymerase II transcription subunit 10